MRRRLPRYSAENFPRIIEAVNYLQEIATAHNATAAQVCIAWLLAQGNDIIPIPGSKQIKYVEENWFAKDIHLSTGEIGRIRELVDATNAHLAEIPRYPKALHDQTLEETPPLEK
jgi:aryl-alcohol dehydrogenase-like predicted oxidoreductase